MIWWVLEIKAFYFFLDGKVLIFVTQKVNSAELAKNVQENGFKGLFIRYFYLGQQFLYWPKFNILIKYWFFCQAALLHGDMHQDDRNLTISNFKKSDLPILVATDVAGMNEFFVKARI
jgi:superfamily II DNA/RNA helicase